MFGFNLYSYCDSNPVVYQDKTGEALINVVFAVIFGIAGWHFGGWVAYNVVKRKIGSIGHLDQLLPLEELQSVGLQEVC